MTELTGPFAEVFDAYDKAKQEATDALLDFKLANDAPARSLSHPFLVAAAMLHWMDKQVSVIHALDRVALRAREMGGSIPEPVAELATGRDHLVAAYEQMRVELARVVGELERMPTIAPPRLP